MCIRDRYGIEPDVVLPENMDYAHRCVLEATGRKDIYFLTNQEDKAVSYTHLLCAEVQQCQLHILW